LDGNVVGSRGEMLADAPFDRRFVTPRHEGINEAITPSP
jgi:hypothetical protein